MSNIFSDPPFARGRTLLGGDTIEVDDVGPVAGRQTVGTVKAFQDVTPTTGQRNSSRLVYCVAARYVGSSDMEGSVVAGRVFVFTDTATFNAPTFAEFGAVAQNSDLTAVKNCGVLDEYLTVTIRKNDIVWLVVKGPTSVQKADSTSIAAGATVEMSSTTGKVVTQSSGVAIGQNIAGAAVATAANTLIRINKTCGNDFI